MSSVDSVSETSYVQKIINNPSNINPHDILNAHFEAIGGLDVVKKEKNFYFEGQMTSNQKNYAWKEWGESPLKSRKEIWGEDDTFIYASGDDGQNVWQDRGGKVTSFDDADSKFRTINKKMSELDYLDPESFDFEVEFDGISFIDGKKCFNVKITNRLTDEEVTYSYDANNFMLKREVSEDKDEKIETLYSDYRDVNGVLKAHSIDMHNVTKNIKQAITVSTYKRNTLIDDKKFDVPEESMLEETGSSFIGG